MAIAAILLGVLGLLLAFLTKGFFIYIAIICGLIGMILGGKQVQAAQEEGASTGLAYVGVAVSVAAMLIGAFINIKASCG